MMVSVRSSGNVETVLKDDSDDRFPLDTQSLIFYDDDDDDNDGSIRARGDPALGNSPQAGHARVHRIARGLPPKILHVQASLPNSQTSSSLPVVAAFSSASSFAAATSTPLPVTVERGVTDFYSAPLVIEGGLGDDNASEEEDAGVKSFEQDPEVDTEEERFTLVDYVCVSTLERLAASITEALEIWNLTKGRTPSSHHLSALAKHTQSHTSETADLFGKRYHDNLHTFALPLPSVGEENFHVFLHALPDHTCKQGFSEVDLHLGQLETMFSSGQTLTESEAEPVGPHALKRDGLKFDLSVNRWIANEESASELVSPNVRDDCLDVSVLLKELRREQAAAHKPHNAMAAQLCCETELSCLDAGSHELLDVCMDFLGEDANVSSCTFPPLGETQKVLLGTNTDLHSVLGHRFLLTIRPSSGWSDISTSKLVLSAARIACTQSGCGVPVLCLLGSVDRPSYIGVSVGTASSVPIGIAQIRAERQAFFQRDIYVQKFSSIPRQNTHLGALVERMHAGWQPGVLAAVERKPVCMVAVRFLYKLWRQFENGELLPSPSEDGEEISPHRPWDTERGNSSLRWGIKRSSGRALLDPIAGIDLAATWPSFPQDKVFDNAVHTDLTGHQAPEWRLHRHLHSSLMAETCESSLWMDPDAESDIIAARKRELSWVAGWHYLAVTRVLVSVVRVAHAPHDFLFQRSLSQLGSHVRTLLTFHSDEKPSDAIDSRESQELLQRLFFDSDPSSDANPSEEYVLPGNAPTAAAIADHVIQQCRLPPRGTFLWTFTEAFLKLSANNDSLTALAFHIMEARPKDQDLHAHQLFASGARCSFACEDPIFTILRDLWLPIVAQLRRNFQRNQFTLSLLSPDDRAAFSDVLSIGTAKDSVETGSSVMGSFFAPNTRFSLLQQKLQMINYCTHRLQQHRTQSSLHERSHSSTSPSYANLIDSFAEVRHGPFGRSGSVDIASASISALKSVASKVTSKDPLIRLFDKLAPEDAHPPSLFESQADEDAGWDDWDADWEEKNNMPSSESNATGRKDGLRDDTDLNFLSDPDLDLNRGGSVYSDCSAADEFYDADETANDTGEELTVKCKSEHGFVTPHSAAVDIPSRASGACHSHTSSIKPCSNNSVSNSYVSVIPESNQPVCGNGEAQETDGDEFVSMKPRPRRGILRPCGNLLLIRTCALPSVEAIEEDSRWLYIPITQVCTNDVLSMPCTLTVGLGGTSNDGRSNGGAANIVRTARELNRSHG